MPLSPYLETRMIHHPLPIEQRKVILCDLDGTLADLTHRRHFVEKPPAGSNSSWRPDWDSFHKACHLDKPIETTLSLINSLLGANPGLELWIVSGRNEIVRDDTVVWLNQHLDYYDRLVMRPNVDPYKYMRDDLLKEGWLCDGTLPKANRVLCVFDDRDRVVNMWRKHGLTCYQVADGDF